MCGVIVSVRKQRTAEECGGQSGLVVYNNVVVDAPTKVLDVAAEPVINRVLIAIHEVVGGDARLVCKRVSDQHVGNDSVDEVRSIVALSLEYVRFQTNRVVDHRAEEHARRQFIEGRSFEGIECGEGRSALW